MIAGCFEKWIAFLGVFSKNFADTSKNNGMINKYLRSRNDYSK
jgi:hypothetical protein